MSNLQLVSRTTSSQASVLPSVAPLAVAQVAPTPNVTVTSAAALNSALLSAHAGETILLAPGTYAGIVARNLHLSGVTITSQSSTNQAVLTSLNVNGSSGLTFTNLTLNAQNTSSYSYNVTGSSDIHFSGVQVTGSLTKDPSQFGLVIASSSNVTVENSTFQQFGSGIVEQNNTNVTISGNSFHQIDGDGIDNVGSSNVTVSSNTFTNFVQPPNGLHPDAIQFWSAGATASASNITISGNNISVGSGVEIQGIFVDDNAGNLPFQNVSITNNTIIGESYNAILAEGIDTLKVSNNTVKAMPGVATTSWIAVTNVNSLNLTDNASTTYNIGSVSNASTSGNTMNGVAQLDALTSAASFNMLYTAPTSHSLTLTSAHKLTVWANNLGDHIIGNNAGDTFYGGGGADTLVGGTGSDTFYAGMGNDTMNGGAGTNVFVFGLTSANDTVTDFHAGSHDVLNISAYLSAGVTPVLQNSGANVIVELGAGHSITLLGVQANQLIHTAVGWTV